MLERRCWKALGRRNQACKLGGGHHSRLARGRIGASRALALSNEFASDQVHEPTDGVHMFGELAIDILLLLRKLRGTLDELRDGHCG